jgi:hypothetical protein
MPGGAMWEAIFIIWAFAIFFAVLALFLSLLIP